MSPSVFLILTFAISLAGFACILAVPAARSPESLIGLPFWLIMVWGPSLAAIFVAERSGMLPDLFGRVIKISSVPMEAWGLVVAPLLVLALLRPFAPDAPSLISPAAAVALVAFNAILGPLGEELGWRGVLQDHLNRQMGWLIASLIVGIIWAIWHLPLWAIDSPHAQIFLPLFMAHVIAYAVIIGAAYTLSGGAILPAILIHLTVNVAANLAIFAGFKDPNAWFSASLGPYIALALGAYALVYFRTGQTGLQLPL